MDLDYLDHGKGGNMDTGSKNEKPKNLLAVAADLMKAHWKKSGISFEEAIDHAWNLERDYLEYLSLSQESYPPGLNAEQKAQFDLQNMGIVKKLKSTRDELQHVYGDIYQTMDRRDFGEKITDPLNPNCGQATRELIRIFFVDAHSEGQAFDLDDMISFLWKLETGGQGSAEEVSGLKLAYKRFYKEAERLATEYTNAGRVAEDEMAKGPSEKKPGKLDLFAAENVDTEAYQQLYNRNLSYFQKQNPNDFVITELRKINYERGKDATKRARWAATSTETPVDPHEGETEKQRAKREKEELRAGIQEAGGMIKMVGIGLRKVFNVVGQTDESMALIDKVKESLYILDSLKLKSDEASGVRRILTDALDKLEASGPAAEGYGTIQRVCQKSAQAIVSDLMQQEPSHIKKAYDAAIKAGSVTATAEATEGSMPNISPVTEQRDEVKRAKEKQKAKSDAILEIDSKIENLEALIAGGRTISSIVESVYEIAIQGGMTYDEFNSLMSRECVFTKGDNRQEDLVNAGAVIDEDAIMKKVENRLRGKPEFRADLATFEAGRKNYNAKRASSAVGRLDTAPVVPSERPIESSETPAVLDMPNPGIAAFQEREDTEEDSKEKGEAVISSVTVNAGIGEGREQVPVNFLENEGLESQEALLVAPELSVAQPRAAKYSQKEIDNQQSSIYEKIAYLNSHAIRNEHQPILDDVQRKITQARAMGNSKQSRDAITHELGRLQHQNNILTFKVSSKLASRSRWERFLDSGVGRFLLSIFAPFRPARPAIPTLYPAIKPVSVATASATAPVVEEERVGMIDDLPPLVSDRDSTVERVESTVSPVVASTSDSRPYLVQMTRDGQDQNRTKILQKITKVLELLRTSNQYSEEEKAEIKDSLMRDLQRYDDLFSGDGKVEAFDESLAKLSKIISRYSESSEEVLLKAGLKVRITDVQMLADRENLDESVRDLIKKVLKADFGRVNTHPNELTARYQGAPAEIVRRMVAEIMLPDFVVSVQNEMIELYRELSEAFKALNPADQVAYQDLKSRLESYEQFIENITQPGALEYLENKTTDEMIEILQNLEGALNELNSVKGTLVECLNKGIIAKADAFYGQYKKIADTQSLIEDASLVDRELIHPNDHSSIQREADSAFDYIAGMMKFFGNENAFVSAKMSSDIHDDFDRLVRVYNRLNDLLDKKIMSLQNRVIDLHRQFSDSLDKVKDILGSEYSLVNYDELRAKKETLALLVEKIEALGSSENIRELPEDQKIAMIKYLKEQVDELNDALKELHQVNLEPVQSAKEVSTMPRTSWAAPSPKESSPYTVSVSVSLNGNPRENGEFASQLGEELVAISGDNSLNMSAVVVEVRDFSVDFEVVCHDRSQLESVATKMSETIRATDKSHVVFAADSSDASDPHENVFQREFDKSINKDKGFTPGGGE